MLAMCKQGRVCTGTPQWAASCEPSDTHCPPRAPALLPALRLALRCHLSSATRLHLCVVGCEWHCHQGAHDTLRDHGSPQKHTHIHTVTRKHAQACAAAALYTSRHSTSATMEALRLPSPFTTRPTIHAGVPASSLYSLQYAWAKRFNGELDVNHV